MFVVTVDFVIRESMTQAFLTHMHDNAKASLRLEPNCLRFDVCASTNDAQHIFLYEIYSSQQDFETHLSSAHFIEFNSSVSPMVVEKKVRTFSLLS